MAEWICQNCQWKNASKWEKCARCGTPKNVTPADLSRIHQRNLEILASISTTPTFEGRPIEQYFGVVSAVVVLGTGLFSELSAGIADMLGTRATAFQDKLESARQTAMQELRAQAEARGANAVVGLDMDYMTIGSNMLMISANGTAVRIASPWQTPTN